MNVVYVTDNYVDPSSGGIARITYVMAQALQKKYGYSCYSVYAEPSHDAVANDVFEKAFCWESEADFTAFINGLGKCIIIIQSPCVLSKPVFDIKSSLGDVQIINVFHGTPGFELVPLRWQVIWYRLTHHIESRWTLKQALLQCAMSILPRGLFYRKLHAKYARPYAGADKMVVLSSGIIDQYRKFASSDKDQFVSIPNALSFDDPDIPSDKFLNKEVLVVARLDDWHKRISEVLHIWARVQHDKLYQDWTLRIVGEGIDKPFYEDYVQQRRIPNVRFEGHQNPLPYYQQASLFLMTSACEGLPMTILEAQQCGCVPILYDSFASAKDIIENGENGILIKNNDRESYVQQLKELMSNKTMRQHISEACMQSSKNYSIERVAAQWNELLQTL